MKWSRLIELRNHTLEQFLSDTSSKEEAIAKFTTMNLEEIPLEEIDEYFLKRESLNAVESTPQEVVPADDSSTTLSKKAKNAT